MKGLRKRMTNNYFINFPQLIDNNVSIRLAYFIRPLRMNIFKRLFLTKEFVHYSGYKQIASCSHSNVIFCVCDCVCIEFAHHYHA